MSGPVITVDQMDKFISLIAKKGIKNYADPSACKKGDIVLDDGVTNVIYLKEYFVCPMCQAEYETKRGLGIHLKDTIDADHMWAPKVITKFLDNLRAVMKPEKISKADIYYFVVEPREILPLPKSVEVDISKPIAKKTKMPTPQDRERYDYQLVLWRTAMKNLANRAEIIPSTDHKDGFDNRGSSGNFFYWKPEVWRNGQWMGISKRDLPTWRTMKHRTLQLWVLVPIK